MSFSTGVQLFTVYQQMQEDLPGTLKRLAEIGFDGVEFCGGYNHPAEDVKAMLKEYGLKAIGWHVNLDDFFNDYPGVTAYHRTIGSHFITIPWYKLDTAEDVAGLAAKIKALAPKLKADGFTLGYHNHSHEFQKADGRYLLDLLQEQCGDLLSLELDVYWAKVGGEEPADYFTAHKKDISLLHMKDGTGADNFTALGKGMVNFPALLDAAKGSGVKWLIFENDNPKPDGFTNLEQSMDYLKALLP